MDDNISLQASDKLDDEDDVKMLTECPQANGQKEQESSTMEIKLLQDIANDFDDDDVGLHSLFRKNQKPDQ